MYLGGESIAGLQIDTLAAELGDANLGSLQIAHLSDVTVVLGSDLANQTGPGHVVFRSAMREVDAGDYSLGRINFDYRQQAAGGT